MSTRPLPGGLLLMALATAACSEDAAPRCRLAQSVPLAKTAITLQREVALLPAGPAFVLATVSGDDVRWARMAADGTIGQESTFKLPARAAGPWLAPVGRTQAGDELLALFVAPRAAAPSTLALHVLSQPAGGAPTAPRELFEVGTDLRTVQVAFGARRDGMQAILAHGTLGSATPPTQRLLRAGGEAEGTPAPLDPITPGWTCLAVGPSSADYGVHVLEPAVAPSVKPTWHMFHINAAGATEIGFRVGLHTTKAGCPAVGTTPRGYTIAWQNEDGTFFLDYDVAKNTVDSDIVAGAIRFGGAAKQPRVAAMNGMGRDFALLFDRPTGPEVWRFDVFGVREGGTLRLPSARRRVGPVAAWSAPGAILATYLDEVAPVGPGTSQENQRYLARVECPTDTPGAE